MPKRSVRAPSLTSRVLLAAGLAAGLTGGPSIAEDNTQQRLEAIEGQLKESETERAKLEQQAAQVEKQRKTLQKQLVTAAAALREQERRIADTETELDALKQKEAEAVEALQAGSTHLAESLAAMQRLSRQPTAALVLRPASIKDTARTAILLDHIRGSLVEEADALREQVRVVQALRASISDEQQSLREGLAELAGRQKTVGALIGERKDQQAALGRKIEEEKARQQALAQEAESLEALLRKLEEQAPPPDSFAGSGQPLDTLPFSQARGSLPLAAEGRIVRVFGQPDGAGHPSKGIYVQTRADAQVITPWDGRVVFAGPFRDYGLLLIIDHGEGYHTLLAGMDVIDVVVSQWILAGEPIGQMGKNLDGMADNAGPKLYIELRQEGRSINPLPWLADTERKVRG